MVADIKLQRLVLSDILIFGLIYMVPTFSHLLAFPLYLLDPMRLAVLGSVIFHVDKRNAYLLALTLPIFSFFIGGHPVFFKSAIIAIELISNVAILSLLERKFGFGFMAIFTSIISSKILYYGLKYVAITVGVLETTLVDTGLVIQIAVALFISLLYTYMRRKIK